MYLYAIQILQSAPLSDSDFIVWSALSALGSCVTRPQVTTVPLCDMMLSIHVVVGWCWKWCWRYGGFLDDSNCMICIVSTWELRNQTSSHHCASLWLVFLNKPLSEVVSYNTHNPFDKHFQLVRVCFSSMFFSSMGYCCPFWGCR